MEVTAAGSGGLTAVLAALAAALAGGTNSNGFDIAKGLLLGSLCGLMEAAGSGS